MQNLDPMVPPSSRTGQRMPPLAGGIHGRPDPRENYWGEVAHIQTSDIGTRSQLILRYIVVVLASAVLVYATGDFLYAAWSAAYVGVNGVYSLWLTSMRSPVHRAPFLSLILISMLSASIYASMPLYLWLATQDSGLHVLALCGMIGLAMFNLTRHTRYTVMAYWDLFVIVVLTSVVALTLITDLPSLSGQVCVGFGALALIVFYHETSAATIRDREALTTTREEVIETQKQATIGQITAGVAHDFNNKLTAIQGNIELAAISHDPMERAALLREARQSCRKAAEVVANMQAFVRKSPLQITVIDIYAFGDQFREKATAYLPETMVLSIQIDDTLDSITCDQTLLETALLNLVVNARDAMNGQGGQITLRIAPGDLNNWSGRPPAAPGPFLRFDVDDEGPGLPVETFNRVQEPFYSSKPMGMGTGLGLSMVKGFAEQIGGALMLRNRVHGGLEVSLILPQDATA